MPLRKAALWRLSRTGPDDASPIWKQDAAPDVEGNAVRGLSCPGVSVSVLSLNR